MRSTTKHFTEVITSPLQSADIMSLIHAYLPTPALKILRLADRKQEKLSRRTFLQRGLAYQLKFVALDYGKIYYLFNNGHVYTNYSNYNSNYMLTQRVSPVPDNIARVMTDTGGTFYLNDSGKILDFTSQPVFENIQEDIRQVSCYGSNGVLLTASGAVYMWGNVPGLPRSATRSPVILNLINATTSQPEKCIQVQTSCNHSAFVTESGELYVCGSNHRKQFGDRLPESIPIPRIMNIVNKDGVTEKIAQVALGDHSTLILTVTGHVYTCGDFDPHSLAGEHHLFKPTCLTIGMNERITQITAKYSQAFFLTETGKVYAYGENSNQRLGLKSPYHIKKLTPIDELNSQRIIQVAIGFHCSAFLSETGEIFITTQDMQPVVKSPHIRSATDLIKARIKEFPKWEDAWNIANNNYAGSVRRIIEELLMEYNRSYSAKMQTCRFFYYSEFEKATYNKIFQAYTNLTSHEREHAERVMCLLQNICQDIEADKLSKNSDLYALLTVIQLKTGVELFADNQQYTPFYRH